MEAFAEEKEAWLAGFLELPNGIPSHDTLSDVLGRIDPVAFRTPSPPGRRRPCRGWPTSRSVWMVKRCGGVGKGRTRPCIWSAPLPGGRAGCWPSRRWRTNRTRSPRSRTCGPVGPAGGGGVNRCHGLSEGYRPGHRRRGCGLRVDVERQPSTLCEDVQLWLDTEVARGRLHVTETVEKDHGRIEFRRYARATRSTGWRPNRIGPGSRPSGGSSPPASSGKKPAPMPLSYARWRIAPGLPPSSAAIGGSKTSSTGLGRAIWRRSPRTGKTTRRKTWP